MIDRLRAWEVPVSRVVRAGVGLSLVALVFAGHATVSANEDHLLFVPKPVWHGDGIVVARVPSINGHGNGFEDYLGRIAEPYMAERRSPSRHGTEVEDVNPVSIAGIRIVGDVVPGGSYKVRIDYGEVKEKMWRDNPELLSAIVRCVHEYGDGAGGSVDFKCDFELVGVGRESGLHAELAGCVQARARDREKGNNAMKPAGGPEVDEPVWHDFDLGSREVSEMKVGRWNVRVSPREVAGASFREDNLELAVSAGGATGHGVWFSSSYGVGSVAAVGRLLFLRYGIGRGTFAREEHVRLFQIGNGNLLEELADVKVSAYAEPAGSGKGDPELMEYLVRTSREGDTVTVTFVPPGAMEAVWPAKVLKVSEKKRESGE